MAKSTLVPNMEFSKLASDAQVEKTATALRARGINVIIAQNSAEAKAAVLGLLPKDQEIFTGSSATVDALGISAEVDANYNSLRVKMSKMDYATQGSEMMKMGATPAVMVGSVHAVTEEGSIVVASATGSQLAGYASGAAQVIWVIGSQKIVSTLEKALQRVEEYSLALEDERALNVYGVNSAINKMLIIHREANPNRTTLVIVKENLGF
jgi:L-lactate utilization protein LutC